VKRHVAFGIRPQVLRFFRERRRWSWSLRQLKGVWLQEQLPKATAFDNRHPSCYARRRLVRLQQVLPRRLSLE
jgi:hypothetical protein